MNTAVHARRRSGRLRAEVERALAALFDRHTARVQSYGDDFAHLWALAAEHAQGGKLVRPMLLVETFDALRRTATPEFPAWALGADPEPLGADRAEVVRIAAGVEALHFAFLLHDDVIDGDMLRRGRPNLIGALAASARPDARRCGQEHWASSSAILAGDLLLSAAHQLFARAAVPAVTRIRLLDLLEHTVFETTAGEFADIGLSDGMVPPDLATVLAMTGRKTATYTFALPLRAAVILAGGTHDLEDTLGAAGGHLGLAYQLQDDLLSTFGEAALHGKDPYSDLREGKQTAIISFARMTSVWPMIEPHFGDPELTSDAAARVRDLLTACGAERFVRDLIDEQLAAFATLVTAGCEADAIPHGVCGVLLELAEALERRQV